MGTNRSWIRIQRMRIVRFIIKFMNHEDKYAIATDLNYELGIWKYPYLPHWSDAL